MLPWFRPHIIDLLPNVSALQQIRPCKLLLLRELGPREQCITCSFGVSERPPSPEPVWTLSEPRIQLLGLCAESNFSFHVSSPASDHVPQWSLMHMQRCLLTSQWPPTPLLCLLLPLLPPLASFTTLTLLSFSHDFFSLPPLRLSFLPASISFLQLSRTRTLQYTAASRALQGGVQLVHYVSRGFLTLMENTQNALAFHHSTGIGETLSSHIASVRESFYNKLQQPVFFRSVRTSQIYSVW